MEKNKGIEQAEVMRRWHEQLELPESERDILEYRFIPDGEWMVEDVPSWNSSLCEHRLRKRPRQKTVTVYLYRHNHHLLLTSLLPELKFELLGQADITYEEPNDAS